VFRGKPVTSTRILSTGPSDLIETRAEAWGRHLAAAAPADRTILKLTALLLWCPVTASAAPVKTTQVARVSPRAFQRLRTCFTKSSSYRGER
jgi:hypothetical protein